MTDPRRRGTPDRSRPAVVPSVPEAVDAAGADGGSADATDGSRRAAAGGGDRR